MGAAFDGDTRVDSLDETFEGTFDVMFDVAVEGAFDAMFDVAVEVTFETAVSPILDMAVVSRTDVAAVEVACAAFRDL